MESGQGIISGAVMAAVDFEAAARALGAGMLPASLLARAARPEPNDRESNRASHLGSSAPRQSLQRPVGITGMLSPRRFPPDLAMKTA